MSGSPCGPTSPSPPVKIILFLKVRLKVTSSMKPPYCTSPSGLPRPPFHATITAGGSARPSVGGCTLAFTAWGSGSAGGEVTPNLHPHHAVPSLHPHHGPALWGRLEVRARRNRAASQGHTARRSRSGGSSSGSLTGALAMAGASGGHQGPLGSEEACGASEDQGQLVGCLLGIVWCVLCPPHSSHVPGQASPTPVLHR